MKRISDFAAIDNLLQDAINKLKEDRFQIALAALDQVLKVADPQYPRIYLVNFYKARILQKLGDNESAEKYYRLSLEQLPDNPTAHNNLANILKHKGNSQEAEEHYEEAVRLKPDYIEAYYNYANFCLQSDKKNKAEELLKKIFQLNPDYQPALSLKMMLENDGYIDYQEGLRLKTESKFNEAIEAFNRAIKKKYTKNPDVYNHLALLLYGLHYPENEVIQVFAQGIARHPNDGSLYNNLGHCLMRYGRLEESIKVLKKAIDIDSEELMPHYCKGFSHLFSCQYQLAIKEELKCIELDSEYLPAYTLLLNAASHIADWEVIDEYFPKGLSLVQELLDKNEKVDWDPFAAIMMPFTNEQYAGIVASQMRKVDPAKKYVNYIHQRGDAKLKIDYVSPDLTEAHPVGLLVNTVYSLHDSDRFETFAYGIRDFTDPSATKIQNSFDHYQSLRTVSDEEAAEKIHADGINVLIDLAGYTKENRVGIFSYQPAPLQIQSLGYTASMQSDFIQYTISSRDVITEELEQFYREKIILMPEGNCSTFLREVKRTDLTRESCGLPENGIVFCCFNTVQRIDETVFTVWMNILKAVPNSVLWLYKENDAMKNNLTYSAEKQGVDSERLVFFKHSLLTDHWHHQLADLWLDTFTLSGGTGGILCANAGLPVLSYAGSTPQSRVGAGIAVAAGNPEMICYSLKEYQSKAIELGLDPEKLRNMKNELLESRDKMPLFNPQRWVQHLESAYQTIWQRYLKGENPETFLVKKISS